MFPEYVQHSNISRPPRSRAYILSAFALSPSLHHREFQPPRHHFPPIKPTSARSVSPSRPSFLYRSLLRGCRALQWGPFHHTLLLLCMPNSCLRRCGPNALCSQHVLSGPCQRRGEEKTIARTDRRSVPLFTTLQLHHSSRHLPLKWTAERSEKRTQLDIYSQ